MLIDCDFYFRWKWMRYRRLGIAMGKLNLTTREVERILRVMSGSLIAGKEVAKRLGVSLNKISKLKSLDK